MNAFLKAGLALGLSLSLVPVASAQTTRTIPEEYAEHIESSHAVTSLGANLFGDSASLYTGQLSFSAVDLSIPGNSALPVEVARRFVVRDREGLPDEGQFGDWELDIPYLKGVFALEFGDGIGWQVSTSQPDQRCSVSTSYAAAPPDVGGQQGGFFSPAEYWHGNSLHVPGAGDQPMLVLTSENSHRPTDGPTYHWVTEQNWVFSCLPTTANGVPGEGFLARAPDGTRYWFNWFAKYPAPVLTKPYGSGPLLTGGSTAMSAGTMAATNTLLYREEVRILPTRVEDRFGNAVIYTYDAAHPRRLVRITSSDGRRIDVSYNTQGRIEQISGHGRSIGYVYINGKLDKVTRPDGSSWQFDLDNLRSAYLLTQTNGPCAEPQLVNSAAFTGSITHPSGAVGTFKVKPTMHGRSDVPKICRYAGPNLTGMYAVHPRLYGELSVIEKVIAGPAIAPQSWIYQYGATNHSWREDCAAGSCVFDKSVAVAAPDGSVTRYTFGNRYATSEGKLLRKETENSSAQTLSSETFDYVFDLDGRPFSSPVGQNPNTRGEQAGESRFPMWRQVIAQDGATFTWGVAQFDALARPLSVIKSSSAGYSKSEVISYHDDLDDWVLGQLRTRTVNGVQAERIDYNSEAVAYRNYAFGKWQQGLTYHADGTLATHSDGNQNVTRFDDWFRGVPRKITYEDATSQSALINSDGTIAAITDENDYETSYAYDSMGRLTRTTYSAGDTVAWNPVVRSFEQVATAEFGVPAGHWRKSISHGNYRKNVFFDALWRPVLVHEYDIANMAGTLRSAAFEYDHEGRTIFASYPGATTTAPSSGLHHTYDALGRLRKIQQDSEIGLVTTTRNYLSNSSGSYLLVTNPRQKQTRIWFQAFDQPDESAPVRIQHPEGAYTDIARDVFGAPQSLTRRNADSSVSVTRYFVYDVHHRLCKRLEPETGTTALAYDNAGNLSWSASGLDLPSTTACNPGDVPAAAKVVRGYDERNRLETLDFSDGNGSQLWQYTADGLPKQVVTFNNDGTTTATNSYTYNKRRLLTRETLAQGTQYSWSTGYGYDANGHLARHTYPNNELTVEYAPNALGQPTKAGPYAVGVSYYPNGAIRRFAYGNGIVHDLYQNARRLPERSRDANGLTAVHDESYDYDANANLVAISDARPGARSNRDMTYDGLDRLKTTVSPMFSQASYTYDVLDNLETVEVASRDRTYHYLNQQLINVKDASGMTVIGLGYDYRGNLANKNGINYTFDLGNRLREVEGREIYRYDAHGRRIQATRPTGGNIYSMYGHDGVLRYQHDYRKGLSTSYVYLGGSLVAEVSGTVSAAAAPILNAPTKSTSGSYTVGWSAVAGANRYLLDESINGGPWLQIEDTTATSWSVTGKTNASYRYRGRACSMECSGYSSVVTTQVALIPQGAPTLTAPAWDADGNYELSWTAVSLAERYELREQVNGSVWEQIADTVTRNIDISGRSPGIYGYRVRACNDSGCADWNGPGAVTVYVQVPPNQVPVLDVPTWGPNGAYTVSWSISDGATKYLLEEEGIGGSWTVVYDGPDRDASFNGRAAGTYAYRVRACNPAGCTAASNSDSADVVYTPTAAPTLTAPGQNTDGSYAVSWTAVTTATHYQLEESANNGGWRVIHDGAARNKARSGMAPGSYRYRVRACNAAGCGPVSAIKTTIEIDPPGSAPSLTTPALSTTGDYTVSWSAVSGADRYVLQEKIGSGSWRQAQDSISRSKAYNNKPASNYSYRVQACNDAGCGGFSATRTTDVEYKPSAAPGLSVPSSSTTGSYSVTWSAVATTERYELRERVAGGSWSLIYNGAGRSKARSHGNGTYEYIARACNDGGCGPYSAVKRTRVLLPPPVPRNLSVFQYGGWSCEISWSRATGASQYQVMLGAALVYDGPNTSYTRSKCVTSAKVRACNASGCSAWSAPAYPIQ